MKCVQSSQAGDYPQHEEFTCFLQQNDIQPDFPKWVIFTDEAAFSCEGDFSVNNEHVPGVYPEYFFREGCDSLLPFEKK